MIEPRVQLCRIGRISSIFHKRHPTNLHGSRWVSHLTTRQTILTKWQIQMRTTIRITTCPQVLASSWSKRPKLKSFTLRRKASFSKSTVGKLRKFPWSTSTYRVKARTHLSLRASSSLRIAWSIQCRRFRWSRPVPLLTSYRTREVALTKEDQQTPLSSRKGHRLQALQVRVTLMRFELCRLTSLSRTWRRAEEEDTPNCTIMASQKLCSRKLTPWLTRTNSAMPSQSGSKSMASTSFRSIRTARKSRRSCSSTSITLMKGLSLRLNWSYS